MKPVLHENCCKTFSWENKYMSKCAEIVCAILSQNTVKFAPINHEGMQQKCCSDLAGGFQRAAASSSSDIGYQDGRRVQLVHHGLAWYTLYSVHQALAWYNWYTMVWHGTIGTPCMVQLAHHVFAWHRWYTMVWYGLVQHMVHGLTWYSTQWYGGLPVGGTVHYRSLEYDRLRYLTPLCALA